MFWDDETAYTVQGFSGAVDEEVPVAPEYCLDDDDTVPLGSLWDPMDSTIVITDSLQPLNRPTEEELEEDNDVFAFDGALADDFRLDISGKYQSTHLITSVIEHWQCRSTASYSPSIQQEGLCFVAHIPMAIHAGSSDLFAPFSVDSLSIADVYHTPSLHLSSSSVL